MPFYGNRIGHTVSNAAFDCDVCDFRMERRDTKVLTEEYSSSHPTAQEAKLFRAFSGLVLGGQPDSHWPDVTRLTQRALMACLESAEKGGSEVSLA